MAPRPTAPSPAKALAMPLAVASLMLGGCRTTAATSSGGATSGSSSGSGDTVGATMGATTIGGPDECESSEECAGTTGGPDLLCVASYDPGQGVKGPAVCTAACVGENDLSRWCLDDAGCCEGLFCREVDGFCEPPSTTSTGTGTGADTGTSTSTGG